MSILLREYDGFYIQCSFIWTGKRAGKFLRCGEGGASSFCISRLELLGVLALTQESAFACSKLSFPVVTALRTAHHLAHLHPLKTVGDTPFVVLLNSIISINDREIHVLPIKKISE